jgi:hypothetical protein
MIVDKVETISEDFATNTWLIHQLIDGLTHSESLLQLPFRGNCLNWVLGHIVAGRNAALELLDAEPVWTEETQARYKSGSAPVREDGDGLPLEDLVQELDETEVRIKDALRRYSDQDLEQIRETARGAHPVWQHLEGRQWHETYHAGQLQILRDLALSNRSAVPPQGR